MSPPSPLPSLLQAGLNQYAHALQTEQNNQERLQQPAQSGMSGVLSTERSLSEFFKLSGQAFIERFQNTDVSAKLNLVFESSVSSRNARLLNEPQWKKLIDYLPQLLCLPNFEEKIAGLTTHFAAYLRQSKQTILLIRSIKNLNQVLEEKISLLVSPEDQTHASKDIAAIASKNCFEFIDKVCGLIDTNRRELLTDEQHELVINELNTASLVALSAVKMLDRTGYLQKKPVLSKDLMKQDKQLIGLLSKYFECDVQLQNLICQSLGKIKGEFPNDFIDLLNSIFIQLNEVSIANISEQTKNQILKLIAAFSSMKLPFATLQDQNLPFALFKIIKKFFQNDPLQFFSVLQNAFQKNFWPYLKNCEAAYRYSTAILLVDYLVVTRVNAALITNHEVVNSIEMTQSTALLNLCRQLADRTTALANRSSTIVARQTLNVALDLMSIFDNFSVSAKKDLTRQAEIFQHLSLLWNRFDFRDSITRNHIIEFFIHYLESADSTPSVCAQLQQFLYLYAHHLHDQSQPAVLTASGLPKAQIKPIAADLAIKILKNFDVFKALNHPNSRDDALKLLVYVINPALAHDTGWNPFDLWVLLYAQAVLPPSHRTENAVNPA